MYHRLGTPDVGHRINFAQLTFSLCPANIFMDLHGSKGPEAKRIFLILISINRFHFVWLPCKLVDVNNIRR